MHKDSHLKQAIHYVSAAAGRGKTHAACDYIAANATACNYLYVAPTIQLLEQTFTVLCERGLTPIIITNTTNKGNVKREIMTKLRGAETQGTVLLVCWNSFSEIPYFPRKENWTIVVDEIPQLDEFHPLDLPKHFGLILDHVRNLRVETEGLYRMIPTNSKRLDNFLFNQRDDAVDVAKPVLLAALSSGKTLLACADFWDELVRETESGKKPKQGRFYFFSLLNPTIFRGFLQVILLGAHVENSLLYRHFQNMVNFVTHDEIANRLRGVDASIGNRAEIFFFLDEQYSKAIGMKQIDGRELADLMDEKVIDLVNGRNCIYATNHDRKAKRLEHLDNFREIPPVSHGMNTYSDYTAA
jgi:hypothetical protein